MIDDPKLSMPQLLTVKQVAEILAVHERTVWKMAAAGEIPKPIKLGAKAVRWRLSDMTVFINDTRK